MNAKNENLERELEEIVPIYVKYVALGQILAAKEADLIERYSSLGFTPEELSRRAEETYKKLAEKEAIPAILEEKESVKQESKLITEL